MKKKLNLVRVNKFNLILKINKLENEKQALEDVIKDELYKLFIDKLKEPQELDRLKKENKNLRIKVKTLKSLLKGECNDK